MRLILIFAVFIIGFIAGFFIIYDSPEITGQAVLCSFENNDCICNKTNCMCGELVIQKELCNENFTLMEPHSTA